MTVGASTIAGGIVYPPGIHSARPATPLGGALYPCTTHGTIDRYDPTTGWATWATPGGTGLADPTTTKGDLIVRGASAIGRHAIGADGTVLTADSSQSDGMAWAAAAGGGSGFTNTLNDPLSSLTGKTGLSGTWTISGGVLEQTDTTASTIRRLKVNTRYTTLQTGIVEVEMKFNSRSGTARMGLLHKFDGAGSGGSLTYMQTTDGTNWTINTEVDAAANLANFGTVTHTSGTWAKLRVHYVAGPWSVILDGTVLDGGVITGALGSGYVGLYTYGCDASFRNLKVWTPTLPA